MRSRIKKYKYILVAARNVLSLILHPNFFSDYLKLKKNAKCDSFEPKISKISLYLKDRTTTTHFDTHYIYHPAWAARVVKKINPNLHIDISSTLHFCTQLSAFIPTKFYDYRPAYLTLSGLSSSSADLTNLQFSSNSIFSLSCMHTVEHIGLGRYGEPVDPEGHINAMNELQRVVAPAGNLLFVVPVGKEQTVFNAHRVYSYSTVISLFNKMKLIEFSLIPDNALEVGIIENADPELVIKQTYGCGCFWFKKIN